MVSAGKALDAIPFTAKAVHIGCIKNVVVYLVFLDTAHPIQGRVNKAWNLIDEIELEIVDNFCYLGDSLNSESGSDASIVTRVRAAWGKSCQLFPLLT